MSKCSATGRCSPGSAAARPGRRRSAQRRAGRGGGSAERQPAGRQRQQRGAVARLRRQRRQFRRRHRHPAGPEHSVARSVTSVASPTSSTPPSRRATRFLTGTTALIQTCATYQAQYSQNWDFGLNAQLTYSSQHINVNSQFFSLNPYTSGDLDLQVTQNLLQGFGSRRERPQHPRAEEQPEGHRSAVQAAGDHHGFGRSQFVLGSGELSTRMCGRASRKWTPRSSCWTTTRSRCRSARWREIEVTRAEAQLYTSQQDLVIAQTNLLQQETVLKNALSRNGVADSELADVHVVPLDTHRRFRPQDEIRPLDDLVREALANRVEIEQARINLESNQLNLVGIKNSLKPTLQAFAELTNNGLTRRPHGAGRDAARRRLSGRRLRQSAGADRAAQFSQLFGGIFAEHSAAQSRGAVRLCHQPARAPAERTEPAQERQPGRVDVQNAVIGLQQARARYDAASRREILQEQTLEADQEEILAGGRHASFRWCRTSAIWPAARALKCRPWRTTRTRASRSIRRWGHAGGESHLARRSDGGRVAGTSTLPANLPAEVRP